MLNKMGMEGRQKRVGFQFVFFNSLNWHRNCPGIKQVWVKGMHKRGQKENWKNRNKGKKAEPQLFQNKDDVWTRKEIRKRKDVKKKKGRRGKKVGFSKGNLDTRKKT